MGRARRHSRETEEQRLRLSAFRPAALRVGALLVFATAALTTRTAWSGNCDAAKAVSTCFEPNNIWSRPGPTSFFSVGGGRTLESGEASVGLTTTYLSRPVSINVGSADPAGTTAYAIDNLVDATLTLGVGLRGGLEVTMALPFAVYRDGSGVSATTGDNSMSQSAFHDVRFGFAYPWLATLVGSQKRQDAPFASTLRLEFGIPFGQVSDFAGASSVTAVPALTSEYRFKSLLVGCELGARLRRPVNFADARMGSQAMFGLGASYDALPTKLLTFGAEAFVLPSLTEPVRSEAFAPAPAEWVLSLRSAPLSSNGVSFSLGGGGGAPTSVLLRRNRAARPGAARGGVPLRPKRPTFYKDGRSVSTANRHIRSPSADPGRSSNREGSMKIVEMQSAKVFWLALEEGDELPAALITALESRGLHAGMVSGSGILEASTMIVFDEEASHGASSVDLPTSWQLASLAGEFGALVEGASMRLRATLSKQSATGHQTMAGDLAWARVRTAQFVVTAYDVTPTAIVVKAPVSERKVAPAAAVPRPLRAAPEPELEIYPEPGDIVVHFTSVTARSSAPTESGSDSGRNETVGCAKYPWTPSAWWPTKWTRTAAKCFD